MAKPFHLIHSILHEPWAISEQAAYSLTPLVNSLFNSNIDFEKGSAMEPFSESGYYDDDQQTDTPEARQSIQVITISGALTKQDQSCGPAGMETIGKWVQEADQNPNIDAIVLKIDSPGGTVSGTETLANIVKSCKKPIIGFVDDMACSAAYWIASSCNEVIANNSTANVGSIGVLMSFADMQPYWEEQGVVFHTVVASKSKDKVKLYEDLRAGKYEQYRKEVLDPLCEKFISVIIANRGNLNAEKYFTGKVYYAKEVLGDLVDQIGSLKFAINRAAQLSGENQDPNASLKTPQNTMKLTRMAIAANVDAIVASQAGTVTITEAAAAAIESAMELNETTAADIQRQLEASQATVTDLQSQLQTRTDQQSRITELEGLLQTANDKIVELEKGPGANTATVDTETDGETPGVSSENFFTRLAKASETLNGN